MEEGRPRFPAYVFPGKRHEQQFKSWLTSCVSKEACVNPHPLRLVELVSGQWELANDKKFWKMWAKLI